MAIRSDPLGLYAPPTALRSLRSASAAGIELARDGLEEIFISTHPSLSSTICQSGERVAQQLCHRPISHGDTSSYIYLHGKIEYRPLRALGAQGHAESVSVAVIMVPEMFNFARYLSSEFPCGFSKYRPHGL
jgi:hypothetical protein